MPTIPAPNEYTAAPRARSSRAFMCALCAQPRYRQVDNAACHAGLICDRCVASHPELPYQRWCVGCGTARLAGEFRHVDEVNRWTGRPWAPGLCARCREAQFDRGPTECEHCGESLLTACYTGWRLDDAGKPVVVTLDTPTWSKRGRRDRRYCDGACRIAAMRARSGSSARDRTSTRYTAGPRMT